MTIVSKRKQIAILFFLFALAACTQETLPQAIKTEYRLEHSSVVLSDYIVHKIKGTELRDGVEIDFFADGKVKVIANYENGEVHGIWLRLNRDGSTCFKMLFSNGEPLGQKVCTNGTSGDFYEVTCGCDE